MIFEWVRVNNPGSPYHDKVGTIMDESRDGYFIELIDETRIFALKQHVIVGVDEE